MFTNHYLKFKLRVFFGQILQQRPKGHSVVPIKVKKDGIEFFAAVVAFDQNTSKRCDAYTSRYKNYRFARLVFPRKVPAQLVNFNGIAGF